MKKIVFLLIIALSCVSARAQEWDVVNGVKIRGTVDKVKEDFIAHGAVRQIWNTDGDDYLTLDMPFLGIDDNKVIIHFMRSTRKVWKVTMGCPECLPYEVDGVLNYLEKNYGPYLEGSVDTIENDMWIRAGKYTNGSSDIIYKSCVSKDGVVFYNVHFLCQM